MTRPRDIFRGLRWVCAAFTMVGLAACSESGFPPAHIALEASGPTETGRRLPAYPLPGERWRSGKADQYDDARYANPEFYAITGAPERPGLRAMVEWEPMSALMLTVTPWVTSSSAMRQMYVEIVTSTTPVADVWVLYESATTRQLFENALEDAGADQERVRWFPMAVESVWTIDYGPLPLVDPTTETAAFADFRYYHGRPFDDAVPTRLGLELGATTYRMPLSFEGGNIQADGQGRCFTTQRGLQYSGLPSETFESHLAAYAGCADVVFLKDVSDDATGHVDMFFKLAATDRAIVGEYAAGIDDENRQRMDDNVDILEALDGGMTVYRLPMPGYGITQGPLGGLAKSDIPFTYANSTLVNGVNLWPAYSTNQWTSSREAAAAVWAEAMPNYQHVAINADEVALASGAIHCITRTVVDIPIEKWVPNGVCEGSQCVPPPGFETLASTASCETSETCFGPAWECECNDCGSGCVPPEPVPDPCEGVTFTGCCDGELLKWCEDGQLRQQTCANGGCGYSETLGFYNCGTDGAPSPDPESPKWCPGATRCEPTCDGLSCGDDGCGGSCGSCPDDRDCVAGACVGPSETPDAGPPSVEPDIVESGDAGAQPAALVDNGGCQQSGAPSRGFMWVLAIALIIVHTRRAGAPG